MADKNQSHDILHRNLLNMMKSLSRIQQERQKVTLGMLETDLKTGGSMMSKMMEQQIDPSYQIKMESLRRFKEQETGGGMGTLDVTPSGTIKRLGLDEMAKREFEKPEGERNQEIIGRWQEMRRARKGKEKEEMPYEDIYGPSKFDPQITEEVFAKLIEPNKSDKDFEEDLKDLRKYRKTYEDMGVNVVDILRRAMKVEKQPKKRSKIKELLNFFF